MPRKRCANARERTNPNDAVISFEHRQSSVAIDLVCRGGGPDDAGVPELSRRCALRLVAGRLDQVPGSVLAAVERRKPDSMARIAGCAGGPGAGYDAGDQRT